MDLLARRVRRAIDRRQLIDPGDRVAVAVSGGADSVALLLLLASLPSVTLAGVIHVHHGLRGAEADADAQFVRDLAAGMRLPVEICHVDVRAQMAETGQSLEAAARGLRYRAFATAADRLSATRVATGHTADDQAETVLLRLLRGSSTRGIGAIRAKRGRYVRPLLECRRAELRRYLDDGGQTYRDDSSNADEALTRNRLRHHLMPAIEADWPGGVAALSRFAELAAADELYLSEVSGQVAVDAIRQDPDGVQVNVHYLSGLHPAIARRVVRQALDAAGGTASYRDVEAVRGLGALGRLRGQARLRGVTAERRGHSVVLHARPDARMVRSFDLDLPLPGVAQIVETRACLQASLYTGDEIPLPTGDPDRAVVQHAALALPLRVRNRKPGDRFRPLGAPGRRKLQDVLVDRKVPRHERDAVPLVVDARGRIVWVAGIALADDYRVTTPESGMVILELKKDTQ